MKLRKGHLMLFVFALVLSACGSGGVTVPDIVGETEDFAASAVRAAGLDLAVDTEESVDVPPGEIIRQIPTGGSSLDEGGVVKVVVATAATFTVDGAFTLFDDFVAAPGSDCSGDGGYSDIGSLTAVTASTINGDVVARTSLGQGKIVSNGELAQHLNTDPDSDKVWTADEVENLLDFSDEKPCLFRFSLEVENASDDGKGYVVEVGDRGELFLQEDELKTPGSVGLSLGLGD